ncbi:S-adenosyl-L-methionine-dependent methyltransferase [Nemania abortiva]|nr:S-adenosyl-L-methionine-dependent methyltransferase [Nemania abortiva]
MASQTQHPDLPLPDYFSQFAKNYVTQTGRTTFNILADVISEHVQTSAQPIGPDSVVHDTAAGPGIGAAAIAARLPKDKLPKEVLVSDNNEKMIEMAPEFMPGSPLPHVEYKTLDSEDLSAEVTDNYFTHSINNFSIFAINHPATAIRETYRTLRPSGLAVVTCWRRFPPTLIVRATQKKIRPDLGPVTAPGENFLEEGELQRVVEEGGFAKGNITVVEKTLLVTDKENIEGLIMFMTGPMMARARENYTEAEQSKWAEVIRESVNEEVAELGGIKFDAYILIATK